MQDAPYDPLRDFAPITLISRQPNVIVVYPGLPVKSIKDLIALAKAKPGELNYASTGTGSSSHLAAELFKSMAGVNIVRIPYKGSGLVINDLASGQVQLMFATAAASMPHIKSGRLRGIAVTSAQASELVPGLPAVAASLPGYESVSMHGVFAPAKTPGTVVTLLNREIVRFLRTTEAKERFANGGLEIVGSSPEQLSATMKAEMSRLGKVIKDAGIKED
jgi:tripartite-type tricarboxylate transporter receptor subunit TctC